jgi:hypothetical protein
LKRRFRVFNTGTETSFNGYDEKIFALAAQFKPVE